MKITIVFAYYLIFLLVLLCQEAVMLAWKESFRNEANTYFLCKAVDHVTGGCSKDSLKKYSHTFIQMNCIFYIMNAFTKVVHLMLPSIAGLSRRLSKDSVFLKY